jgi:hypothetical protein
MRKNRHRAHGENEKISQMVAKQMETMMRDEE